MPFSAPPGLAGASRGAELAPAERLEEVVASAAWPYRDPIIDRFVARFRQQFRRGLAAVIFYGSCLSNVTRSATSVYDFYLVCDHYGRFHRRTIDALINPLLPPNVYDWSHDEPGVGRLRCKFCVISLRDLQRHTSPRAHDLYHSGRFSKRVAIPWARDGQARDEVVRALAQAARTVARLAMVRLGERPFSVADVASTALGLSYEAETRVEAADKVERIHRAERTYYDRAFAAALAEVERLGLVHPIAGTGQYRLGLAHGERVRLARRLDALLRASRRRSQLRWPKNILTFGDWIAYMKEKIERTQGFPVEMTPLERRVPLLLVWRYARKLLREGRIRHMPAATATPGSAPQPPPEAH